jgi:Tfp pilus assembly PilM family ATPase
MSISTASLQRARRALLHRATTRGVVGVDIAGTTLRIAQATGRGEHTVWSVRTLPLPPEACDGSPGADRRLGELAREATLPRGRATVCLTSPVIDVFPLMLPVADGQPLDAQVVAHARDQLNYPLAEAVLDYTPLPETVRRKGEGELAVLVFCAPRAVVEVWSKRLASLGIEADRLLTPACALAPWVRHAMKDARLLVITTTDEAISIAVIQQQKVLLERVLPWGRREWIARLQAELDLNERQCHGLLAKPEAPAVLQDILGTFYEELAHEADNCIAYCNSYLLPASPAGMILAGPLADHAPLRSFLEREFQLSVRHASENLGLPGFANLPDAGSFAAAAGCALWTEEARA